MSDTQIEILVAIITGAFTIIATVFETNKSSKLKYITGERSEWRKQMRAITSELMAKDNRRSYDEILTDYKTRLNAFGNINRNDYLHDGHIWDVIYQIEKEPNNQEYKNKLVLYISLLLKFDWERAKSEVSYKIPNLVSLCLYVISNVLLVYFIFVEFKGSVKDVLAYLTLFSVAYFVPIIMKKSFKFFAVKGAFQNTIVAYLIPELLYIIYILYPDVKGLGVLNVPIILQFVSLVINEFGDLGIAKQEKKYIESIEKHIILETFDECEIINKSVCNVEYKNKRKKKHNKFFKNVEKYKFWKCIIAPWCVLGNIISYLFQLIRYIFNRTVQKEYNLVYKIKEKIQKLNKFYK